MHADAEVMADQGGAIGPVATDEKFDRYVAAYREHGVSRWAVEDADGVLLGYSGVLRRPAPGHPLGPHCEIGWRFVRRAWGHGYATESSKEALRDAFVRAGLKEIVSYTSPDNLRSQAVMARLGLRRDPARDFIADDDVLGSWHGLVWVALSADGDDLAATDHGEARARDLHGHESRNV